MKIYKYRDLSRADAEAYRRVTQTILENTIWCSRPDALNDPDEFSFRCDYRPTDQTKHLLAQVLVTFRGLTVDRARHLAFSAIAENRLKETAIPIVEQIIANCRKTLGLACFSKDGNNPALWERYGGKENGLCVEIEVPDRLMNQQLFSVDYLPEKTLHVDALFESVLFKEKVFETYRGILLTKTEFWKPESEVRFVTREQNVAMRIDDSRISQVMLGSRLNAAAAKAMQGILATRSYHESVCEA